MQGNKKKKPLRHTKYAVVNRRVRILEKSLYLEKVGIRKTQAGFTISLYQLTFRGYLGLLLNQMKLDNFVQRADESTIVAALAALTS